MLYSVFQRTLVPLCAVVQLQDVSVSGVQDAWVVFAVQVLLLYSVLDAQGCVLQLVQQLVALLPV